ncbi:hypothetical protein [Methylobacterium sp. BTF04]|nr:hypothetical protein [Methylobacterium sp. BTF04]
MRMLPLLFVFALLAAGIGYALAADDGRAPAQHLRGATVPPFVP